MKLAKHMICMMLTAAACSQGPGNEPYDGEAGLEAEDVKFSVAKSTATTAVFSLKCGAEMSALNDPLFVVYYSDAEEFNVDDAEFVTTSSFDAKGNGSVTLKGLRYGTTYKCQMAMLTDSDEVLDEVREFTTTDVDVSISVPQNSVKSTSALVNGTVTGLTSADRALITVGLDMYQEGVSFRSIQIAEIDSQNNFEINIDRLNYGTEYQLKPYIAQGEVADYDFQAATFSTLDGYSNAFGHIDMSEALDLSATGTANSYIVSEKGTYRFKTVKGNTQEEVGSASDVEPVGTVSKCAVLWESFGTSSAPECCELISSVYYEDGYIAFKTADVFKEGNALLAALDNTGKILWSWHIWMTDVPEDCTYRGNAGIMMDRNLGAVSVSAGDALSLGLLYQWGRKDPFLSSSDIHSDIPAGSTIVWPAAVRSDSVTGTISWSVSNPTSFIGYALDTKDWLHVQDDTRWGTSKTKYDPCPSGYKVPDGGSGGFWKKASFSSSTYDEVNEGIMFKATSPASVWYPAAGFRYFDDGSLGYTGVDGYYWTTTPSMTDAFYLYFNYGGYADPLFSNYRSFGFAVRCRKE